MTMMNFRIGSNTLPGRLVLLVMSVTLPFVVYSLIKIENDTGHTRASREQQMETGAQLLALRMDQRLREVQQQLTLMGHILSAAPKAEPHNSDLLRQMSATMPSYIYNISAWAPDGSYIGAARYQDRLRSVNISDREHFGATLLGQGFVVDGPMAARSSGSWIVTVSTMFVDEEDRAAILVGSFGLEEMHNILTADANLVPTGTTITLVRPDGIVLAHAGDAERRVGELVEMPASIAEKAGAGGGIVSDAYAKYHDTSVRQVAAVAPLQYAGWHLVVGMPVDLMHAAENDTRIKGLLISGMILLGGLGLAWRQGLRITRPLHRIGADILSFGKGDLTHRCRSPGGSVEMEDLASTFNAMADRLQQREKELHLREQRMHDINDNLPVGIVEADSSLRFVYANRHFYEWTGMTPETLLGRTAEDVYGNEVMAEVREHVEAVLAGEVRHFERFMQTHRGLRRVEVTETPRHVDEEIQGMYVMYRDVSAERELQEKLLASETRLSLALEGADIAPYEWDISARRIYLSKKCATLRGLQPVARSCSYDEYMALIHPDDAAQLLADVRDIAAGRTSFLDAEYRISDATGGWVWLHSRGRVFERDVEGRPLRMLGVHMDISTRKEMEQALRDLSETDALTGLPNRRLFRDRLSQALLHAERRQQPMALLFLDVDHFKRINDTLGHEAGDQLLIEFAKRLRATVRKTDTVARIGGDEFTIILEGVSETKAQALAAKLVDAIRIPMSLGDQSLQITTSIGGALCQPGDVDGASLQRRADEALYETKRRGRDGLWFDFMSHTPDPVTDRDSHDLQT